MNTKDKWEQIIFILGLEEVLSLMVFLPREISRIDYLYYIIDNLRGSYSPSGIRSWFRRPRKQLDGKSPEELIMEGKCLEKIQELSIMKEIV